MRNQVSSIKEAKDSQSRCLPTSTETNGYASGVFKDIYSKGYFVEPKLLEPSILEELRLSLPALIAEDIQRFSNNPYYKDHQIALNLMFRGRVYRTVMTNPRLIEIVDCIMGTTSILNAYNAPSTPAGASNSARIIHTDCPPERLVPGFITNLNVVIAVDPFTIGNGATFYYPNSQTMRYAPSESEFYQHAQQVELHAGDAIFFNAHIWHAAGVNKTSKARYGLGMNFIHSFMRQRFDFPRMTPPDMEHELSPLERRLLGFNVRVPASLDEFYVEPAKRLYLANQG